ncbi:MAG: hypothetical protein BWY42_01409 [Candidatus Omnitrophica bacterium ADurb.Bin277]|nr:MAG: hypothetical protein BWY42_01409 [Candidatus Omnitrophica bacterium ADurb.Bin277]
MNRRGQNGVRLDFIKPGKSAQNTPIKNPNRKFREDCLNEYGFFGLEEAGTTIGRLAGGIQRFLSLQLAEAPDSR